MKKFVGMTVVIVAVTLWLLGSQVSYAQEADTIIVNDVEWAPYFFGGVEWMPKGFGRELLELCIPETGYKYEFKAFPVQRTHYNMQEGKMELTVYSYKKEREEFVLYGKEPLFATEVRPAVLASKDIKINSIADFDQLRLGHLAGLAYTPEFLEYVNKREQEGRLDAAQTIEALMKMLIADRIDVVVDSKETFLWNAKQLGVLDQIKIADYLLSTKDYFVTISKKSPVIKDQQAFLDTMDSCIKAAKADGRYAEILLKYGIK